MSYIPDITERFPEGFGGVDMTPSFFGEPVDWDQAYKPDDDYEDVPFPRTTPLTYQFEVGQKIVDYEFDGGVTEYGIARITKNRDKVLVTETWFNIDGSGKRKPHWCKLIEDEYGNEKFQIDPRYDSWITARRG